jgi:transcription termination/antitermination protein NusA
MSREIIEAVRVIEKEKGIEGETLIHALEDALLAAYKKTPGASRHATVELDDEGDFRVYSIELPTDIEERLVEEARERAISELEALEAENGERSHTLILDEDLVIDWSEVPEDVIKREDVTPHDFGRIAAQTAKQVILQRIREAEREMMYDEYVDRVTEVVTGIVQQAGDRNNVLVDLGKVEALLPRSEQVDGERYEQGSRIKAVITEVRSGTKGPQVILSRRDPELIRTLFELEVPEIADGLVEIRGVAREPGYRSKIAVESHAQGVDPVGACVGPRGSRVRMVVSELRGEKIDIIPWNTEPARFIAKALSPARVREVFVDDETKEATVVVPEDQLALAIGKEGLNARLAARLTGWKVDIQSDQEFAQAEAEAAFAGEEDGDGDFSGRCVAVLANGKRCPNASLPGSRFCGIPSHQEMAQREAAGEEVRTIETVRGEEADETEPVADAAPPEDELTDSDVEETVAVEEPEPRPSGEEASGMPDAGPEDDSPVEEILIGSDVVQGSDEPVHESAPLQDDADEEGPSAA